MPSLVRLLGIAASMCYGVTLCEMQGMTMSIQFVSACVVVKELKIENWDKVAFLEFQENRLWLCETAKRTYYVENFC